MILKPCNDTLITMARLVHEHGELNFLTVAFSIRNEDTIIVTQYDPTDASSYEVLEEVTIPELLVSYLGLSLPTDLDANDAVTTGHRLGNTGR